MSQSAYVISKYHKMSSTVGSEELLIDIGANSRVRIFSIFAVNNFNATANSESGFSLQEGSGGSDIYSSGVTVGSSGTSLVQPLSQVSFPSHGIVSLSDVFVSGIGTTGVAALTVFYQVG
tara:strand:- start:2454 stop:2813 length:360 start_codon:yes stop_codon:yes gene_type:complete